MRHGLQQPPAPSLVRPCEGRPLHNPVTNNHESVLICLGASAQAPHTRLAQTTFNYIEIGFGFICNLWYRREQLRRWPFNATTSRLDRASPLAEATHAFFDRT
jgi:hypothetical protein